MKIEKIIIANIECISLEYVLDAILIDNSPEAIKHAVSYVWSCKRNSWKDAYINIDTLIEILDEIGVEHKDIYDDEDCCDLLQMIDDAVGEDNEVIYIFSSREFEAWS
jgi:hypothetical protein